MGENPSLCPKPNLTVMDDDKLMLLLDGVLQGEPEAFTSFVIVMTTSTQAWMEQYLGYSGAEAEPRARAFVKELMISLAADEVTTLLKGDAGAEVRLGWLRLRRRNHFFPHMAYEGQAPAAEDRTALTGAPEVQQFVAVLQRVGRMPRDFLRALMAEDPQQALRKLADEQGLAIADVRIHLTKAVRMVARLFKGREKDALNRAVDLEPAEEGGTGG